MASAVIIMTGMTACDTHQDEEQQNSQESQQSAPVAAQVNGNITISSDMLNCLDLTVSYYDAQGRKVQETLTDTTWNISLKADIPGIVGYKLTAQPKQDAVLDSTVIIKRYISYGYKIYAVDKNDKTVGQVKSHSASSTLPMKGNQLTNWLSDKAGQLVRVIYEIDNQGNINAPTPQG